jgi:DNA-binding response OmpR family regulator
MKDTILIVEDNEDILDFLAEVLGSTYTLHQAKNGQAALDILEHNLVNLIVSDIMMPGIDGFQLCETIKSKVEYCHIPVVLLTAKNTYAAHIEGLEVGADAYIRKPFSPELLQVQIANLLRNRLKIKDHFANSPFEDIYVTAHSRTDQQFLKTLDDYIRSHLKDPDLDIDGLAEHMNMSRPTFYRKIRSLSSLSPKELVDRTRLKKAAELIAQNEHSLAEITSMVGYSSQSVFGKNFQRHFHLTPMEYFNSLVKK